MFTLRAAGFFLSLLIVLFPLHDQILYIVLYISFNFWI